MVFKTQPEKKYKLHTGEMVYEYDYLMEQMKNLKTRQQMLEEDIELLQLRIDTAEGHP